VLSGRAGTQIHTRASAALVEHQEEDVALARDGVVIVRNAVETLDEKAGDVADRLLYQETKRRLAHEDGPTMQQYAEAKSEVVEAIIRRALDAGASSS
jgi:hypothetical protein